MEQWVVLSCLQKQPMGCPDCTLPPQHDEALMVCLVKVKTRIYIWKLLLMSSCLFIMKLSNNNYAKQRKHDIEINNAGLGCSSMLLYGQTSDLTYKTYLENIYVCMENTFKSFLCRSFFCLYFLKQNEGRKCASTIMHAKNKIKA